MGEDTSDYRRVENERARARVKAFLHKEKWTQARLAREIRRSETIVSKFIRGLQGLNRETAKRIAKELGYSTDAALVGPEQPGEGLELEPGPPPDPIDALSFAAFMVGVHRRGLYEALMEGKGRWLLTTVLRAITREFEQDDSGLPKGGWAKLLDMIEDGRADTFDPDTLRADRQQKAERRPSIPKGKNPKA